MLNQDAASEPGVTLLPVAIRGIWLSTTLCRASAGGDGSRAPSPMQQAEICIPHSRGLNPAQPGRSPREEKGLLEGAGHSLTSSHAPMQVLGGHLLFGPSENQQDPKRHPAGRLQPHGDGTGSTPVNNTEMGER